MDDPARTRARAPASRRTPRASPRARPQGSPTILLSVAGLSPQVITETLYCLRVQRQPPADVRQVHVLTTYAGEQKIRETILKPGDGWFARFCRDFGIPDGQIRFDASTVHVLKDAEGKPLEDVRTPEHYVRLADALLGLVRDLTRDPALALHASVAGGRKTMGLFLGIAFQLFARPQDRLSHVLVLPPDLENCSEFYYPPPVSVAVTVKGKTFLTSRARVELAEIPVVLLRGKIRPMGLETLSYTDLIARGQRDLDRLVAPPSLVLRSRPPALEIAEARIPLTPMEFAVYRILVERRRSCGKSACLGCEICALEASDFDKPEVRAMLAKNLEALKARDERARALAGWRDAAYKRFREVRARINGKIGEGLGPGQWAGRYAIAAIGKRPDTRYYIPLAPELIHLE